MQTNSTVANSIADAILEAIWDGKIPSETPLHLRDIANMVGVSVTPVREALRNLEGLGVVKILPHRGAYVCEASLGDAEAIYEARLVIEPLLMKLSAERWGADSGHQEEVKKIYTQMSRSAGKDWAAYRKAHRDLHWRIYELADSPWLLRSCRAAFGTSERYRVFANSPRVNSKKRLAEHKQLVDYWLARKGEEGAEFLRKHLVSTLDQIRAAFAERS